MIGARELVSAVALGMATPAVAEATPQRPEPQRFELRSTLFDKQLDAWDCTANLRCMLTSRRAGKSTLIALWLLEGADAQPNGVCVYIAPTQKHARRILWRILVQTARAAWGDRARVYESTMTVITPSGGTVRLGGCDDKAAIAPHVGEPFVRAAVDECGKFPSDLLRELVEEALEPATVDYQGQIILAGTPGVLRTGYWHELTGPARSISYPVFEWTLFDNPHIPHARAFVDDLMRRRGWTDKTPAYMREYLGRWCDDSEARVFPLSERNIVPREVREDCPAGLPARSRTGAVLPVTQWRYVIGVDVGVVDATSLVVMAAHPFDPRDFCVSSEKYRGWLPAQLRDRLRQLRVTYPNAAIVMDTGGMGKVHAEELTRQWALAVEPAEKTQKRSHVRDVRDRMQAGLWVTLDGPECDAIREEMAVAGWDEDHELVDDSYEDHAIDGALYATRRLWHYRETEEFPKPMRGSREAIEAAEEAAIERRVKQLQRVDRSPGNWR